MTDTARLCPVDGPNDCPSMDLVDGDMLLVVFEVFVSYHETPVKGHTLIDCPSMWASMLNDDGRLVVRNMEVQEWNNSNHRQGVVKTTELRWSSGFRLGSIKS